MRGWGGLLRDLGCLLALGITLVGQGWLQQAERRLEHQRTQLREMQTLLGRAITVLDIQKNTIALLARSCQAARWREAREDEAGGNPVTPAVAQQAR